MTRFVHACIGGVALLVAGVLPAFAADIAVKAPPIRPAVPAYSWAGFYVGGHLGYGWSGDSIQLSPDVNYAPSFATGAIPFSVANDPKGWVGGVQWGTNYQWDRLVAGFESDQSYTGIKDSQSSLGTYGEQKLTWFGTTRARAGFALQDNLLIYGTGGLANGTAKSSVNLALGPCGGLNCAAGSESKLLWGWAVGGGVEYGVGPWSAKVEYLHYDLGDLDFTVAASNGSGFISAKNNFSGDIVRGGVNYRFNWTPWQLLFGR